MKQKRIYIGLTNGILKIYSFSDIKNIKLISFINMHEGTSIHVLQLINHQNLLISSKDQKIRILSLADLNVNFVFDVGNYKQIQFLDKERFMAVGLKKKSIYDVKE
jgi:hypothetical protein